MLAASGRTVEEAAKFRESYLEGTGKLLMFASVVGIARGAKAVKVKMKKGGKVGGSDGVQDPTVVPNSTNRAAHEGTNKNFVKSN